MKKTPTGAHYGLRDWLIQRATAALLILAIVVVGAAWVIVQPSGYEEFRALFGAGWMRILLFCGVLSLAWHGYIGARDILMDYIHHDFFRLCKTVGAAAYLIVCVIWAARILL